MRYRKQVFTVLLSIWHPYSILYINLFCFSLGKTMTDPHRTSNILCLVAFGMWKMLFTAIRVRFSFACLPFTIQHVQIRGTNNAIRYLLSFTGESRTHVMFIMLLNKLVGCWLLGNFEKPSFVWCSTN